MPCPSMHRECVYKPGEEYIEGWHHSCWKYNNDPAYRALWDGKVEPVRNDGADCKSKHARQVKSRSVRPPSLRRRIQTWAEDTLAWVNAGKPTVTEEVHAARYEECQRCPFHDMTADKCKLCGCPTHATALGDKLRRATSQCPDQPPRWLRTVPIQGASSGPTG